MSSLDDWNEKRRKKPFVHNGFNEEFEIIFKMMEKMMKHAFLDINFSKMEPDKSFASGENINIGFEGNPKIQEFRKHPREISDESQPISDESEPLTEIIEGDKEISITVEIPEVEKKDIDLRTTENNLEIRAESPYQKFHRDVILPCKVKPKTTKATYKNGVLDVIIKRKTNKHDKKNNRVDIE